MIPYIRQHLPPEELLAQLAEEAAELGHAALKLRRVYDGRNPTPVDSMTAFDNLCEEIADVFLCLQVLGFDLGAEGYEEEMAAKLARWGTRLFEVYGGGVPVGES